MSGEDDADAPKGDTDSDDSASDADTETAEPESAAAEESSSRVGGFLGNLKNARGQLGDAKDAFSNARGAGSLPTDEEGRVRIVCRRYEEQRLAPLDERGRPTCYDPGNEDCEACVDAVSDGTVETW